MSENSNNKSDAALLEELRCSVCSGYLSCSPVRLLPNGIFICGQCSPPSNDSTIYRAQALEAILEKVSFPCRFAQHGCGEHFVFGQTVEHELKCEYRSFACPSQGTACCWKGTTLQMLEHFTEAHPEQILENANFKLQLDENSGGISLVSKENVLFVIKHQYKAEDNHLTYDIRFCKNDSVVGASYKFQLINDSDREYNFNLKTTDCKIYNDSFYGVQNLLNLNKFLEALDNPNCILITINLEIHHNVREKKIYFEMNHKLLNTLKCSKCCEYLIPPLFCLDKKIICRDCAETNKNYLPHDDNELLQLLNETNFPCHWRNCGFITKNNNLKKHELECQFRQYNCNIMACIDTFTLASAVNHYKNHGCQYRDKELTFITTFAEGHGPRQIFTINKHTIIFLQYLVSRTNNTKKIELRLGLSNTETVEAGGVIHEELTVKTNCDMLHEFANTTQHEDVRQKLLELIQAWTFAFRKNPKHNALKDIMNIMKAEGYKFPTLRESDAMFSVDSALEWADGEVCHRCHSPFGLMQRKYHCHNCAKVFCGECCWNRTALPKFGTKKQVRVCDACYDQVTKPPSAVKNTSEKSEENDLPTEYLTSSLPQQSQISASDNSNNKSDAALLEQLRCSICSGYLSCGPVRVLPNGTLICGQCSPPSNDSPVYRVQVLEPILEKVSFPCRFAELGCTERFVFGQTVEHELKCEYRSFACPSQGSACYWKGSTSKMLEHFTEAHPEQVVENAYFKLQLDENSDGVILVSKENVLFVIKHQYNTEDNHLTYDIRFCKNDSVLGASYKFQLINDSDREYSINLKTTDCKIYNDSFYGMQNLSVLNVNKFLEVLDNPNCMLITISLEIRLNVAGNKTDFEINHELLNTLKCSKCYKYLVPPLFRLDENIICCDCAKTNKNFVPHDDKELLQLLNETNFPCRWRNCEFIRKIDNLKKHELECQFRQYNCFVITCKNSFTLASAINHYKMHECQYRDKELIFTTSFAKCHDNRFIFTIKKHTIILLEYSVSITNNTKKINLALCTTDAGISTARIQFEHQHCKVKSKSFEITRNILKEITISQLPPCFKEEDELTGVLII